MNTINKTFKFLHEFIVLKRIIVFSIFYGSKTVTVTQYSLLPFTVTPQLPYLKVWRRSDRFRSNSKEEERLRSSV